MIFVESDHKPVCVIVPRPGNLARYEAFESSLEGLQAPPRSFVMRVRGSSSLALGVNAAIKMVLASPDTADVGSVFFIDDDHEFAPDTLMRLLADLRPPVHVLMALCMRKEPPFDLMAFTEGLPENLSFKHLTAAEIAGKHGPTEVSHVGRGGLLVNRTVFEFMNPPWFAVGQINPEEFQEDLYFSIRCRDNGFATFVHLDVVTGHVEPVTVVPQRLEDGRVVPTLKWGNGKSITLRGWK
jgi:hypothetical protein